MKIISEEEIEKINEYLRTRQLFKIKLILSNLNKLEEKNENEKEKE